MQAYTAKHKVVCFTVSLVLLAIGTLCCQWIWSADLQLRFPEFGEMVKSMSTMSYLWLVVGLVILQEMIMLFFRYCLGRQGKKDRLYIVWKSRKFGLHHLHWGLAVTLIGLIGQLTESNTNMLIVAIGVSFVLSDFLHHRVLETLHGDHEGDGPLRNPFRR